MLKHIFVAAGLMTVAMSSAHAAPIAYVVNYSEGGTFEAQVQGTVTTDGKAGTLTASDILSFNLSLTVNDPNSGKSYMDVISNTDGLVTSTQNDLRAVGHALQFADLDDGGETRFSNTSGTSFFSLRIGTGLFAAEIDTVQAQGFREVEAFPFAPGNVIGVSADSVSAVPLPASAPMFGAALLSLGAVGYGVKRKKAAIAA